MEELRQKGLDGTRKAMCHKMGGGGVSIIFGPKYRPLFTSQCPLSRATLINAKELPGTAHQSMAVG
jgi:hypothetical protein